MKTFDLKYAEKNVQTNKKAWKIWTSCTILSFYRVMEQFTLKGISFDPAHKFNRTTISLKSYSLSNVVQRMDHPKEVAFWQEWGPESKTGISPFLQPNSNSWYT